MLSIIVAHDKNRVIGINNQLPWHLPKDLEFFKKTTLNKTIIMGRKTFDSIGKKLPDRQNVVITRNNELKIEDVLIINKIEDLRNYQNDTNESFVIGGEDIFIKSLPFVNTLYITEIEAEFEGDTFFPIIDKREWNRVFKSKGIKDEKNPYDYYFCKYERK